MNQNATEVGKHLPAEHQDADDAHYLVLANQTGKWTGMSLSDIPEAVLKHFPELLEVECLSATVPQEYRGLVRGRRGEMDVHNSCAFKEYSVRVIAIDQAGQALMQRTTHHAYEDVDDTRFEIAPQAVAFGVVDQYRRESTSNTESGENSELQSAGHEAHDYHDPEYWAYVVGEFTCGLCSELAVTLHERFGWQLRAEIAGDGGLYHAWAVNHTGKAVDINGVHSDDVARTFPDEHTSVRDLTREALVAFGLNSDGLKWAEEILAARPTFISTPFDWSKSHYVRQGNMPVDADAGTSTGPHARVRRNERFILGRNVSLAIPLGGSTLRPTRSDLKTAARKLGISIAAARRALTSFNEA